MEKRKEPYETMVIVPPGPPPVDVSPIRKAVVRADGVVVSHGFCDFTPEAGSIVVDAPSHFPYFPNKVKYVEGVFTAIPDTSYVPTITRRQFRLWLLHRGFKAKDVAAAINTIANPIEKEKARIEWEDAEAFHYDHPLITQIATILMLEISSLPNEFQEASKL